MACDRQESSGRDVPYERQQATRALNEAIEDLAAKSGRLVGEFEGLPMGQAYDLACDTYAELPDFWRIWNDWQGGRPAPMGEL